MIGTVPLQSFVRAVIRIQETINTQRLQIAATALVAGSFLLTILLVFYIGRLLKGRYSEDTVEAGQSLVVTVAAVVLSGFLVAIWRIWTEVTSALAVLQFGPQEGVKALVSLIVLAAGYTLTRLSKRSIKYGVVKERITPHQREVAHHLVQIAVFIPVVLFIVTLWQIPVRSVFLGAGAIGIIIGFAARRTLSGALSGFVILFARPFEIGDWIAVEDREGIVTDITLYNTQIRTFDEEHVLVPNDTVTGSEIVNYTKSDRLRITLDVGVDYDTDVTEAAAIAVEVMESCESVAATPKPDVVRQSFDDSAVLLGLRFWIERPTMQQKWKAQNEVIDRVKSRFEEEGIKMPFPQRELSNRSTERLHTTPSEAESQQPSESRLNDGGRGMRADSDPGGGG
ncbi:MAG: mechanosensitive ion channel family protein [Natronomonas sp.]